MAYWLWSVSPDSFGAFVRTETFALRRQGVRALAGVRPGDRIFAYLPGRRVLAGTFEAVGAPFEDATPLVPGPPAPHRVRVRALAVLPEEAQVPYDGFAPHLGVLDLYADRPTPALRFRAVVQRVLHRLPVTDGKVLEFVVQARLGADPDALMAAVEAVREARALAREASPSPESPSEASPAPALAAEPRAGYAKGLAASEPFERALAMEALIAHVEGQGFVYAPWEVAAFVTALRTKPFAILAGVTGVGKSALPRLVAQATGGHAALVPVRPDWTDPAEALGYADLGGRFRPGVVLRALGRAAEDPARQHLVVLDEMNLARPEHYLADVLSRIEHRTPVPGGWGTDALVAPETAGAGWGRIGVGPNVALVGTVNVDESAHALSRKVLDRAFVLELSASDLAAGALALAEASSPPQPSAPWPAEAWRPRALRLAGLGPLGEADQARVRETVEALAEADALLAPAGLGVGYRTRDETALFVLHAAEAPQVFRTRAGRAVDPLDLALLMRLVPRLEGVRPGALAALDALLAWAWGEGAGAARGLVEGWAASGRAAHAEGARFPRTAARLARMAEDAEADGVVSFWG